MKTKTIIIEAVIKLNVFSNLQRISWNGTSWTRGRDGGPARCIKTRKVEGSLWRATWGERPRLGASYSLYSATISLQHYKDKEGSSVAAESMELDFLWFLALEWWKIELVRAPSLSHFFQDTHRHRHELKIIIKSWKIKKKKTEKKKP